MRVWGDLKNARTSECSKVGCSTEEPRTVALAFIPFCYALAGRSLPSLSHLEMPQIVKRKKKNGVPSLRFQAPVVTPLTRREVPSLDA